MIPWTDIACIVFTCVTANHLGLVKAVEDHYNTELPIINCVKCFTFWCTLIYTTLTLRDAIPVFAISFLASYSAMWLELLEGYIDTLYNGIYEKIYQSADNAPASDYDQAGPAGSVSEL